MTKKKPSPANSIDLTCRSEEKKDDVIAQVYLTPEVMAAANIKGYYKSDDNVNINALIKELSLQSDSVHNGNTKRIETMLISQAHSLESLFTELIFRSRLNMGEYMHAAEKYMRLALKAQSQCRCTLETLANIKNPQPYIQNNRAQYQQVNNGIPHDNETNTRTHTPARENFISSNELLSEDSNNETLDTGRTPAASGTDQDMEAVGEIHRG